jgi:DNA polymerase
VKVGPVRLETEKSWYGCESCGLAATRNHVVIGYGNTKARLMFVGEGPGAEEDSRGIPFIGPAGQLLRDLIDGVSLSMDEIFLNNIVACRAFTEDDEGNRKDRSPKKPEILACRPRLNHSILSIDPILIVALGNTAFHALTGDRTLIGKARGGIYEAKIPGPNPELTGEHDVIYPVLATYHPSFLRRRVADRNKPNSVWDECIKDLLRAVEMLDIAQERYDGIEKPER